MTLHPSLSLLLHLTLILPTTAAALSIQAASPPALLHPNAVYPRANAFHNLSSPTPDKPLILASYTSLFPPGGHKTLSTSISRDGGKSWRFLSDIWTANATTHDIDNAYPLQLPNGHILVAFRNHDIGALTGEYVYYRITICLSTDYGQSWEFLSHASERWAAGRNSKNGLWEPLLRADRRGRVQVYYSSERGAGRQDNVVRVSDDLGRTWGDEVVVSTREGARDGMMGVVEVVVPGGGEGRLVCVFETTEEDGRFAVEAVESLDDGGSWGEEGRRRVYTVKKGKDAGAPQVVSVGGWLVGSFMTNEGVDGGEGEGVDGGEMKIVISKDGGRSWDGAAVAAGRGSHWPGLYQLDDRRFLGLYSADGVGAVSRIFEIDD
ncbi:Sialidase [Triangularia verruculosa]|uniref:Sialidase n=1 Tax=Triangularia verruculosa TaxID=2587418 RepID=A0AAN6XRQ4_9PEZI|nr:Sialidase [Triangularia verruculosa]